MGYWEAIFYGLIQGLTEFLPVSSSGHLVLAASWLGLSIDGASQLEFVLLLHLATTLSVIFVFRHRLWALVVGVLQLPLNKNHAYIGLLLLSALPAGVVGLFFKKHIEQLFSNNVPVVGICLCLTSLLLFLAQQKMKQQAQKESYAFVGAKAAFFVGLAQAAALLPGLSRSGLTLSTALFFRIRPAVAADFVFLMSLVPIMGATFLEFIDVYGQAKTSLPSLPACLGALTAFLTGVWACKRMIGWIAQLKLSYFIYHCAVLGLLALIISWIT